MVDAQRMYLPDSGIAITDDIAQADIVAVHAGAKPPGITNNHVVIAHNHGLYWNEYQWDKWELDLNQQVLEVIRQSDAVTAPSEWVANSLRRGTWRPVTVIPHGVDSEEWQPPTTPAEPYVLWNKSRVDPVCNPEAVDQLADMFPRVQFRTTFSSRGLPAQNVQVYGALPYSTMHDMVRYAGVYLCTARETFGIGTLEAMACGVPVLGWNFGGQADIVQHQVNGWLCEPGDYGSLAAGLKWCFENRVTLSQSARARALEYSWPAMAARYAQLYLSTLAKRDSGSGRVTIVVTSHNLEQYLPEALDSAISEARANPGTDIVIVDDCSTDDSYGVALKYMRENPDIIRAYKTPSNLKLPGALNFGVERARGQYILPLDADNLLPQGAVALLAGALDQTRSLDIAYGRVKFVLPNGVTPDTAACGQPPEGDGISGWPPEQFSLAGQLSHKNQIPSGSMYRRRVWETVGGYRWRCRNTAEDADFWCRAGSFGFYPAQVTHAVTMIYRNRPDSMSHVNKDWPWHNWYPWGGEGAQQPPYVIPQPIPINTVKAFAGPKIAVVIPVGPAPDHAGCLLMDALDSVYAQSFKDWECIVVNDSGTDLGWVQPWAKVVRTSQAGKEGAGIARNVGLMHVAPSAKWWIPLDADDYLEPEALQKLYHAVMQKGGYAYSDYRRVETFENVEIDNVPTCEAIGERLIHPVTALYPILSTVRFEPTLRYGEDWDFVLAMHAAGYCGVRVSEPLVYYRRTSGSNRVNLLAQHADISLQIKNKWRNNMAGCGCGRGGGGCVGPNCGPGGGGGAAVLGAQNGNGSQAMAMAPGGGAHENMTEIEYLGTMPSITYSLTPTRTQYKFGSDRGRKRKYVLPDDVDYFLARTGEFQRAQSSTGD